MKTPKHLFSAHDIAAAIGRNFNATMKFLAEHNIKPVREIRTGSMTYRQYSKSAMNEAISIADKTLTRRKKSDPVQAPLPFTQEEAQAVREAAARAKDAMAGVDIDKAHEPINATLPPNIDITVTETKHAEEMLSVMRSIDEKLGRLLAVWEK